MFAYRLLCLLLFLLLLVGCKLDGGGGAGYLATSIGEQLVPKDQFSSTEKGIATKICYAFQSKRSNFVSSLAGETFRFDVVLQNYGCKRSNVSKRLETTLVARSFSEQMFFDSADSDDEFERYIQTNVHGYLVDICDAVMRGEPLPSPVTKNGSSQRELIEFYSKSGLVGFVHKNYLRDWSQSYESYILTDYDDMTVLVDSGQDKYGIVLERTCESKCDNSLVERKSQLFLP